VDRRAVDRPAEHLGVLNQPMARIEEQNREDLVLEARELGAQILLDRCRRTELGTALHLLVDDPTPASRIWSADAGR
jgi:hypothetical protein